MTLKSVSWLLAAATAVVALLAFPQPGAAQAYSDSFEGATINSWWTQEGSLPFGLSTLQKHTGSQSLVAVGSNKEFGRYDLTHVFSEPVRGDFSVWVYDYTITADIKSVSQDLRLYNASGDGLAHIYRDSGGSYFAETDSGTSSGSGSCPLGPLAASPEWRKMRLTVRDTDIVFQAENGSGTVAACTLPYTCPLHTCPLTAVGLSVGGEISTPMEPYAQVYFDDFSYTPPGGGGCTVSLLYDPTKAAKSGSTIPIKLQLLSGGVNLSSPSLVVHAVALVKVSGTASDQILNDAGNANPDFDFRYDTSLAGYIFNLKTTGLTTGTYNLIFTVNALGDPTYFAPFQVE